MRSEPARRSMSIRASMTSQPPTSPPPRFARGPFLPPRIPGRRGVVNDLSHFGELEPEDIALPAERMCAPRRKLCQRGRVVLPIRVSSIERAHWRPSRIAQTTRDWPRRMSPAANSFGTLVL